MPITLKKNFLSIISMVAILITNSVNACALVPAKKKGISLESRRQLATDAFGSCGDSVNYTFTANNGELKISGTGAMANYSSSGFGADTPWNSLRYYIKSVKIEEGVTHIGDNAFYFCSGLSSADLSKSIISIGNSAFQYTDLTSIDITENVKNIGKDAFLGCKLTSVEIPKSIKVISCGMFYRCEELKSVTIPESVTTIEDRAFSSCKKLCSINITENVTSIGKRAFEYCEELVSISIPSGISNIEDGTFYNCKKLKSIIIPNKVSNIGSNAFGGCSNLTSITIPNNVINIGSSAFQSSGLKTIAIPNGVQTIGDYAFSDCPNLTSANISDSVINITAQAFNNNYLDSINVSENNANYKSIDGILFSKDQKILIRCPTKKSDELTVSEGTLEIGEDAFWGCEQLKLVKLPTTLFSICANAFRSCSGLTEVLAIPGSVATIGECAFYYCIGLNSIIIPNSVKIINSSAFGCCNNLNFVTYGGNSDPGASSSNVFFNCNKLKEVLVPANYKNSTFCGLPIKKIFVTKNYRPVLLKFRKYAPVLML